MEVFLLKKQIMYILLLYQFFFSFFFHIYSYFEIDKNYDKVISNVTLTVCSRS